MDLKTWKEKNARCRNYAHFDKRISIDQVWSYITDPLKIETHNFYPFIHCQMQYKKYSKQNGIKIKEREICYSSHIDRYIFQYYGYLLNQFYNERIYNDDISQTAIAYRDNLGKNNIHFAKRAIDEIKNKKFCYVIVGDFTRFFDNLDHVYLKKQLCSLLNVGMLPKDYYSVYKNITKYSTWDLTNILEINGLKRSESGIEELNNQEQVLTLQEFKRNKKGNIVQHKDAFGIPQGSAISAVLSNIYMLDADKEINEYVNSHHGMYMRYSDDFIVILPDLGEENFQEELEETLKIIGSVPGLELEPDKTQLYHVEKNKITCCSTQFIPNAKAGKNFISYLGFTYDGNTVTIRDKTISKYYYRMYRKAKTIAKSKGYTRKGNRITSQNLYLKYSEKGANQGRGNFLTYVKRAEIIFGKNESINRSTKNHMQKIKRKLN